MFVGSSGVRVEGDSAWARHVVTVRAPEPGSDESRPGRWFLGRSYIPVGDWSRASRGTERRAVELGLTTTEGSLIRTLFISLGGLSANIVTLGILLGLGFMISMIEGFAVRSGRSIVQAVVDEAASLRAAAERFGRGELDYRLPVRGKDEFGVVAASLNDMAASLMRQRQELAAAERMEEDLAVARGIQQRFLPQQSPRVAGLDVAGVSLPSREVGGDLFYWFTHEDGSLGFTLGDVSGKSVPAALLMSNVLAALRAQAMLHVDLAESVARVNRFIVDQVEPGRFVTLVYGEVEPAGGTLRYASAGHNPPLLIRMDGRIEWLQEGGLPLGVKVDATYSASSIRFERGDTLIAYSDGVTEAMGPGGGFFGEDRLAAMALTQQGKGAKPTIDALLEAVRAFAAGAPQADDITIVVVRRV